MCLLGSDELRVYYQIYSYMIIIALYLFSDIWFCLANLIDLSCNGKRCYVMGSILRCPHRVIEGVARHACIVAIKDKKMGSIPT